MVDHAAWLRRRAESYWRDSLVFDSDDVEEAAMRAAYRTIANELCDDGTNDALCLACSWVGFQPEPLDGGRDA